MAKNNNTLIAIIAVIALIVILNNSLNLGLFAVFEANECETSQKSDVVVSYNSDGYKYTQTLTAVATLCYPSTLPVYLTEGDIVQLKCTGSSLYIDTTREMCGSNGCKGGELVDKTYDYVIKPGQTQLTAVCWTKRSDLDVNDEPIWVWTAQEVSFSFDGINPLVVVVPEDPLICGDGICSAEIGETCEGCKVDCEEYLQILNNPRVYLGCPTEEGEEEEEIIVPVCTPPETQECMGGLMQGTVVGDYFGVQVCSADGTWGDCMPRCQPGSTKSCEMDGCAGTQVCTNNAWGACEKDDMSCGIINPSFCDYFDFLEPAFGDNSCIVGTIIGFILLLIFIRMLLK